MPEYKNGQESSQLVTITGFERTGKDTKLDKITVTYDKGGQTYTASKFTSAYTADEKALIQAKGQATIVKVYQQKEGQDKGYWNLKTIKAASEFKEKKQYQPNNKTQGSTGTGRQFNEAGVKVGAVLHDAVALAVSQLGTKVTTKHVQQLAQELLTISVQLESEVKNGKYDGLTTSTGSNTSAAPTSNETSSESLDSLDDLLEDFNNLD